MKKQIVFLILPFTIFVLSACNKSNCSHCLIKDNQNAIIKDYKEKCGESKDISDYEKSAAEDAVQYGGTFSCTTK